MLLGSSSLIVKTCKFLVYVWLIFIPQLLQTITPFIVCVGLVLTLTRHVSIVIISYTKTGRKTHPHSMMYLLSGPFHHKVPAHSRTLRLHCCQVQLEVETHLLGLVVLYYACAVAYSTMSGPMINKVQNQLPKCRRRGSCSQLVRFKLNLKGLGL